MRAQEINWAEVWSTPEQRGRLAGAAFAGWIPERAKYERTECSSVQRDMFAVVAFCCIVKALCNPGAECFMYKVHG